jgi:glycosyltransferase involved in cell wall biosynthesis
MSHGVSILLAVYNGEKFLSQSIDSILYQTFKDWELLIGFNGTTDNSKEIVNKYTDSRIRTFDYGDSKGKPATLNKLLKESKFDLIALQDDDDIWFPKKLELQIEKIDTYDIIGSFITYIDVNNDSIGAPSLSIQHESIIQKTKAGDNQIANSSALIKKNKLIEINGWDETLKGLEDLDVWLKLINSKCVFYNIPKSLVMHRLHSNSNFNTQNFDINYILNRNL